MESQRVLADRYALVSHLARGGMADVFVAEDRRLGRRVAVKVLHGEFAQSPSFVQRFQREARAAAGLSHPNIVGIYDWGEDHGVYYMVMELVEGRNLRQVLKSDGPLLANRVAEIGAEVAEALAAAHAAGIVHRDIKPANILLTADGSVKVTDFGIALAWNDSEQLTRTGAVMGTATYFSPEQAQGASADLRTDIYSLGVVLYELLTGRPPFSGESPVAVAYQHVREEPVRVHDLAPSVPAGLEAIVMACLAKDPGDRYQSAADLVTDLDTFLAGGSPAALGVAELTAQETVVAGTPPPPRTGDPYRSTEPEVYAEPGRTDRTTVVAAVLGGIALLGLGVILLWQLLSPSGESVMVNVPNVAGQERTAAVEALEALDLNVIEEEIVSTEVAAGFAVRTNPAAGRVVESRSEITLFVSIGPASTEVPRVIDLAEAEARSTILDAGLTVGDVSLEPSLLVDAGLVISQTPAPGQEVEAGTAVDLVISAGDVAVAIPDVVGKTETDALFQLEQAGFTPSQIRIERQPSADVLEGFVIETDPPAGQAIPEGGWVTVFVSEGATPTVLPDVVGMEAEMAQTLLEELGFEIEFADPQEVEVDSEDDGKVVEMDPAAGTTQEYGSTVTLTVGQAPGPVAVPDLVGRDITVAEDLLAAAGLVLERGEDRLLPLGDDRDGQVFSQDPPAGEEVPPDTVITVEVGVARVEVPSVIGFTPEEAQIAIEGAGLVYSRGEDVVVEPGSDFVGRVASQSPPPTSQVGGGIAPGSTITVNIGVVPTAVPDLDGMTVAQARAAAESAGFTLAVSQSTLLVDPSQDGRVQTQSPSAGDSAASGSTITVTVGRGGTYVPDLEGLARDDTETALAAAGLTVYWNENGSLADKCQAVQGSVQNVSRVARQDPVAGTLVDFDSEVRVWIGRLNSDQDCTWDASG